MPSGKSKSFWIVAFSLQVMEERVYHDQNAGRGLILEKLSLSVLPPQARVQAPSTASNVLLREVPEYAEGSPTLSEQLSF